MNWIFTYLKPLRRRIAVGMIIKSLATFAELMIPFLLSYILENVIQSNRVESILLYGALMVLCALIACLGNLIANRMAARTTMLFATRSSAWASLFFKETLQGQSVISTLHNLFKACASSFTSMAGCSIY